MTGPNPTSGIDLEKKPHTSILKRIDIGLLTGICAVFISALALITSRAQMKAYAATQKAAVMPVIDIDMGYLKKDDRDWFEVKLSNVGAGIAYIQKVTPTKNGAPVTDYDEFDDSIMTRRMRSWSTLYAAPATGYLRAGEHIQPRAYRIGGSASELGAYKRGRWGTPMEGLDIEVCYCSVFEDCWTVKFLDRKRPQEVGSCGIKGAPIDAFKDFIDGRAATLSDADKAASEKDDE